MSTGQTSLTHVELEAQRRVDALEQRLAEAEDLIKRGVVAMRRTGWEPGETDSEWIMAARMWEVRQEWERG